MCVHTQRVREYTIILLCVDLNSTCYLLLCVQIYGSTSELAERLRDPQRRGWLLEGDVSPGGKPFLPFDEHSLILCDTGTCIYTCRVGGTGTPAVWVVRVRLPCGWYGYTLPACDLSLLCVQAFMLIAVLVFWLEM